MDLAWETRMASAIENNHTSFFMNAPRIILTKKNSCCCRSTVAASQKITYYFSAVVCSHAATTKYSFCGKLLLMNPYVQVIL